MKRIFTFSSHLIVFIEQCHIYSKENDRSNHPTAPLSRVARPDKKINNNSGGSFGPPPPKVSSPSSWLELIKFYIFDNLF